MRDDTVRGFLERLAARVPAPGGGAVAALHAAQAAALLGMVARYSTGERYAAHAAAIEKVTARSDELRVSAFLLAERDTDAFTAVTDAYRLPKASEAERAARAAAIADALVGAARPQAEVIGVALAALGCAEELLPVGNRNLVTDVAAAAEAARAAAATARGYIEVNLAGLSDATDPALRDALAAEAARADEVALRAGRITAAVREEIAR